MAGFLWTSSPSIFARTGMNLVAKNDESKLLVDDSISIKLTPPDDALEKKLLVGGFPFESRQVLNGKHDLHARSTSHLRIWGFDVAAAVLYMPMDVLVRGAADVLNPDVPKQLKVKYMRILTGDQFRWVTKDTVQGNGFKDESVAAGLDTFNAMYRDVGSGDTYDMSYDPGTSKEGQLGGVSTLSLNGLLLGSVIGRRFSQAIFSVWFGERVWFEQMKVDLLAGASRLVNE